MSGNICPHCGNTKYAETFLSDDSSFLQAEAQRIDALIRELQSRRAAVRRKINRQSAATRSLPQELLSDIFTYAYPTPSFSPRINLQSLEGDEPVESAVAEPLTRDEILPKPLGLGAVCTYWRQVAWDTPGLWVALDLRPFLNTPDCKAAAALLCLYTRNVGPLGLSVQIVFHWTIAAGMVDDSIVGPIQFLGDALCSQETMFKTHMLVLSNPPSAWIPCLSNGFINMHTLAITTSQPKHQFTLTTIDNVPSLRHVSLRGIQDLVSLPIHQLLSLTLRDMPLDLTYHLMGRNIISFRTRLPRFPRVSYTTPPSNGTLSVLNHIEHLEWTGVYHPWDRHLQHFRFPSLRYLQFHGDIPPRLLPWFETLPSTLKTFHSTDTLEVDYLIDILYSLPQLETLVLEKCEYAQYILERFGASSFSSSSNDDTSPPQRNFLPNLTRLKIEGTFADYDKRFPLELTDAIAEVLPERIRTLQHRPLFSLEIDPAEKVQWSPEASEKLKVLTVIHAGRLRILVGGKEVSWT
ncbi:hypothetical protein D9756_002675 [Leucocoprinus leucothites]|uniref:F-box domain-containing protein n=1 Tax=Leucocoprinus leucothites TaxID=201217 RepID=A0A8H5GCL1_9AGAR|nr:hypothetical protein D9756_002675 [Leucoagaricus leucothites]